MVDEAIAKGCNLIVSHHPLLFHGLKRISGDDYVQRCVIKAIKHDIVIISMHTNMDNALNGVNWKIAERLGATVLSGLAAEPEKMPLVLAELPQPMDARAFIELVKNQFHCECAQCNALLERPVRKVAICGGAGDFLLPDAISQGADAFITGEMHYHQYFGTEQQIQICVIGHYQSEQYTSEIFRDIIQKECPGVRTEIAETCTNPILYI
jgi:dinuclear metal center YbgI/SA1388 family protein